MKRIYPGIGKQKTMSSVNWNIKHLFIHFQKNLFVKLQGSIDNLRNSVMNYWCSHSSRPQTWTWTAKESLTFTDDSCSTLQEIHSWDWSTEWSPSSQRVPWAWRSGSRLPGGQRRELICTDRRRELIGKNNKIVGVGPALKAGSDPSSGRETGCVATHQH